VRRAIALVGVALGLAGAASRTPSRRPERARGAVASAATQPITPVSLAFPTPDDGWVLARNAVAGAELLATHDAGATWITQWTGNLVPEQVVASDPDHAWILGQTCAAETCRSVLLGTSDAGAHWSALAPLTLFASPPLDLHVSQVAFASPTLGLAAARDASCHDRSGEPPLSCPGWILKTDDGGLHWHLAMKSPEPVVSVTPGARSLWALIASPGGEKIDVGAVQPSLVAVSSADGGRSWRVRGAVHPPMAANLDVEADILATPAGRLWLTAHDPETCAMHGCGLDGAWSSADGGRRWHALRAGDAFFERGVGMPCGYGDPIVAGATVGVSFNSQACAGPAGALYRLSGSHRSPIHIWRSFFPAGLAWPSSTVGYALGTDRTDRGSVRRTTDGGRRWRVVAFTSS
jgi:hypothetical protein